MGKEEAINILIGLAVCISPKLYCDESCPFYNGEEDCRYINREFELEEAVKVLNNDKEEVCQKKKRKIMYIK